MDRVVRNSDNDAPLNDASSTFTPRRARRPLHDQREVDAPPIGVEAGSPPVMQEPPWKLPSLEPDWLPPPPTRTESALGALGRLVGVIVIAAVVGAVGSLWGVEYFLGSAPRPQNPLSSHQANVAANLSANPAEAPPATRGLAPGLADDDARRAADVAADPVRRRATPVPDVQSASAPSLPAPPAAPSRSTVLQSNRQSSPDPASAPAKPLDAADIALMLKSGAQFRANGNIAAARMMLQRAADAGDATAAFALAETYDPVVLAGLGVRGGIAPDVALAERWYAKANALGTSAAEERLVRLTHRSE